ncbi:hypothetical protein V2J09_017782 [Rumex salicifolius]
MTTMIEIIAQLGIGLTIILVALPTTLAGPEIPTDASALKSWYSETIGSAESRKGDLDPNLVTAEASPVVIKVRKDGSGEFESVQKAIDSVKLQNTARTIIDIGPGEYKEKIKIERFKPYITFLGDPKSMPTLVFNGVAAHGGTDDSATVIVEADYFVASNIIFKNSSPRPTLKSKEGQALALRIQGDKAAVYNCRLIGFQDTLCDDKGMHLYKDCYIEGTVDFIFGAGQSMFLNCEIHVIPGDNMAMITAQGRNNADDQGGFVIVHCKVTGTGGYAVLGRTWMSAPKVIFLHSSLSDAVAPAGWSSNFKPDTEKTAYFAESENEGPGADLSKRVPFMKKIAKEDTKPYLTLNYIKGMMWLLPPPEAKGGATPAKSADSDAPASAKKPKSTDSDAPASDKKSKE